MTRRGALAAIAACAAGCAGYKVKFGSKRDAARETDRTGASRSWTYEEAFLAWRGGFRDLARRFERRRPTRAELEDRYREVRASLAALARYLASPEDRETLADLVDRLDRLWATWDGLGNPDDFRARLERLERRIVRALGPGTRAATPSDRGRTGGP